MRSGLLIGFILLVNLFVSGQSLFSHNFTVNDGLPSNTIRCIYKDTKDRMWIGTGAGLCQYDGKEFTILGVRNGLAG
ncbi:MAG: hypothetical protein IPH45_20295 [Bacteroidales bacterium]|nr:hypothetical protein [Bacteroidales bacterium]